ncbi:L,D-transpeptidase, partial [Moraxella sp.]|uniref:L,D-transpeptidase n=1 Tax=Moraxella sp. TaxID=479 RepID=UPI003377E08E|nr:L,D-transpeptidase [Moraxella sp.]
MSLATSKVHLLIDTANQTLDVYDGDELIKRFSVSTAKNGAGQLENTGCTPLGRHTI